MDYEYDDEPLEGRILWGRIAVYGVAFALVFLLGNCLGSRGGPTEDELTQVSDQVRALASENAVLEDQLAAATAGGGQQQPTSPTTEGPGSGGGEEPDPGDGGGGDGTEQPTDDPGQTEVYTVRSGDSLYSIATEFYGDGTKWRVIADENGLDDDNRLTVGQELRIPPAD
jgi:nucleoid-associated protein YgaU